MTAQPEIEMAKAYGKVRPLGELATIAARARKDGKAVVLAHGVFDLLHHGHIRHLEAGRREGDVLMVTVTADPRPCL